MTFQNRPFCCRSPFSWFSSEDIMCFHGFHKSCHYFPTKTHFRRRVVLASKLMLWISTRSDYFQRNYTRFRRQVMIASRLMLRTSSKISFSPKELHMFLEMSHVSIRMTPVNLVGLGHPEPKHAKILNDVTRNDVGLSQGTHKNIIRHSPLMNKNSS